MRVHVEGVGFSAKGEGLLDPRRVGSEEPRQVRMTIEGIDLLPLDQYLHLLNCRNVGSERIHNGINREALAFDTWFKVGQSFARKIDAGGAIGRQKNGAHVG